MINGTFPILRSEYFSSRLDPLDAFDGFCPRWIIPQTRMVNANDVNHDTIATNTLLTIDSKCEIYVGVGLNSWPPAILEQNDV